MTNELQAQNFNYVYLHVDPETQEVVYVGMGTVSRAWDVKTREVKDNHYQWLQGLLKKGYVPSEWVSIEYKQLSREDAYNKELELIHMFGPKFNSSASWAASKYTPEDVRLWMKLREEGKTYKEITLATGVSEMVIYRALSGQTAAYRNVVNG